MHKACKNHTISVRQICDLNLTINGATESIKFLISDALATDLTLGKNWLKSQKVVHNHALDCLYIGANSRQCVYLNRDARAPLNCAELPSDFLNNLSHGFPEKHAQKLESLIRDPVGIFLDYRPLR